MRKVLILSLSTALALTVTACGNIKFPGAYKPVIQQGNIISQEDIDQLKPGMTKRQVNFVLGTPLITDSFNPNRWDYMYTIRDTTGKFSQKRLTVFFEADKLTYFIGDYKPSSESATEGADTTTNADEETDLSDAQKQAAAKPAESEKPSTN